VKTREHYEGADFDAEEETVGKITQTCAMHIPKNYRELVRVLLQTEDSSFNFLAKTRPEAGMLGLVPILGVHEFGTRGWRENYLHRYGRRANSARNCSHVTAWARS
jgi:hypothetical protein